MFAGQTCSRSAAGLRIQKRILVREIVKAALGDYFENRQGLVTENANRQFPARHKFLYQQFAIIFRRFGDGWLEFAFFLHDDNADGGALSRRLDHDRQWHRRTLSGVDHFPFRRRHTVFAGIFPSMRILSKAISLPSTPSPV